MCLVEALGTTQMLYGRFDLEDREEVVFDLDDCLQVLMLEMGQY